LWKRKRPLLYTALGLNFCVTFWFAAVDWSWFEEQCPNCRYACSVTQYRVACVAIHEQRYERLSEIQLISADLGWPCDHANLYRWHKHRWWGLCKCAAPCHNGTLGFTWDEWYDDAARKRVRRIARRNPERAAEFHQRVVVEGDMKYWQKFVAEIAPPQ
jgi:hypothetical protein